MDGSDRTKRASRRWGRKARAVAAAVVTAGTLAGTAVAASAAGTTVPCGTRALATPFTRWSDSYQYFLIPDGAFESGASSWALSGGAKVVSGNESFKVHGSADAWSLQIPAGARAESRTICISKGEDVIRLFVKNPKVSGAILHIEVNGRNPDTGAVGQTSFDVNADAAPTGWSPTMRFSVPAMFSGTNNEELTFVFTTRGTAATWAIDDVYVDPFKTT